MSKNDQTQFSLEELWRAQWKLLSPAAFSLFEFDELALVQDGDQWILRNGAVNTDDHPTSVKCTFNIALGDVSVAKVKAHPFTDQRTKKWMLAGAGWWEDAITPARDWRGFTLVADPSGFTRFLGFGVFEDLSVNFFSFKCIGDANVSTVSTVPFSTGWHRGRMWFDGVSVWAAMDDETPILLTSTPTDIPAGSLQHRHGALAGDAVTPATLYPDAVCVASERP